MKIQVQFRGGLELLFGDKTDHEIEISKDKVTMAELMAYLRDNLLQQRPDLFMKGTTIRPGVLVLINEADWELSSKEDTELENGDQIAFISTLHGG